MRDGVYGRTHTYSYVKSSNGKWYKSVESTVTEVRDLPLSYRNSLLSDIQVDENAVISDSTGLHMGAGPFMLLYSQEPVPSLIDVQDEPKSGEDDAQEAKLEEGTEETHQRPSIQHTYTSVAEEYAQWHPSIRQAVRNWNAQFRTTLEDASVVDADGKIRQDSPGEGGERVLPEDPLARMYFEEQEDSMDYDSDARDIEEVVMDTTESMTAWGLSNESNVSQGADTTDWGPKGENSSTWDDATKEVGWDRLGEDPGWDAVTNEWKQQSATEGKKGIEVQVTRDVESKVEDLNFP